MEEDEGLFDPELFDPDTFDTGDQAPAPAEQPAEPA